MSLRFTFKFKGIPVEPIEPALLAEKNPLIGRLRGHLLKASGGKQALADQALAGFLARIYHAYGEAYFTKVSTALEKIYTARNDIHTELDRVLNGELPQFEKIKKGFQEIDLAFPEVIDPKDFKPPSVPLSTLLAGGKASPRLATLTDVLGRLKKTMERLTKEEKDQVERAGELDSESLRKLIAAEEQGTLKPGKGDGAANRPYESLMRRLQDDGWDKAKIDRLMATVERLNEAWRNSDEFIPQGFKEQMQASIDALGKEPLPDVAKLQGILGRSRRLGELFNANPDQVKALWTAFRAKTRPYSFGLYVWFNMLHVKGSIGEFTAAFELGKGGVMIFLKGPKPEVTTGGTDLVCFDRLTGEIFVIDNKAVKATVLDKVSALMRNLPQNLAEDARAFAKEIGGSHPAVDSLIRRVDRAAKKIQDVANRLSSNVEDRKLLLDANADVKLANGEVRPVQSVINEILQEHGITRLITNAGGKLERLSAGLEEAGILLENLNE